MRTKTVNWAPCAVARRTTTIGWLVASVLLYGNLGQIEALYLLFARHLKRANGQSGDRTPSGKSLLTI